MSFQGPVNTFTSSKKQKHDVHGSSDSINSISKSDKLNSSLSSSKYSTSQDERMDSKVGIKKHNFEDGMMAVKPSNNIALMTVCSNLSDELDCVKACLQEQETVIRSLQSKFLVQREFNERINSIVNRLESDRTNNALAHQIGYKNKNSISEKEVDHYFRITFHQDFQLAIKDSKAFTSVMYFNYFYFYLFISLKSICLSSLYIVHCSM
jgi:hypothetical protein